MSNLNDLAKSIYLANVEKGFYEDAADVREFLGHRTQLVNTFNKAVNGQRIALIQSEASEALEADRKNRWAKVESNTYVEGLAVDAMFNHEFEKIIKDTVQDEIADVLIRVLDFCGANNIDIDFHVKQKLRYNSLRPHKHGKTY